MQGGPLKIEYPGGAVCSEAPHTGRRKGRLQCLELTKRDDGDDDDDDGLAEQCRLWSSWMSTSGIWRLR